MVDPFQSMDALAKLYKSKAPSGRKVIKSFITPETMNDQQRVILSYLTQFIKTLERKELCRFLRFVTGFDNMPDEINVVFSHQTVRAPRARVCTAQLELSDDYSCYPELAEEFNNILNNSDSFRFSFV